MKPARIQIHTRKPYEVVVGPGVLSELPGALAPGARAAVLSDATVDRLHASRLGECVTLPRLVVQPGEGSKTLVRLEEVLEFLVTSGLDRRSTLVTLGGGVIGDLGGLAAALYMRGIALVQCPTTLLSQVDASVGGKVAVNLPAGKNLVGAFHQPKRVLADTTTLSTLSDDELRSGLGEVVKSALIGDPELLSLLEREVAAIFARDAECLGEIVARCVLVKAAIVGRDEEESGERRFLNLGHTFAHAIERAAGYGRIPHGIAVGVGLVLALRASESAGVLGERALRGRVTDLLARLGLPDGLAALRERTGAQLAPEELRSGMRHDKKSRSSKPAFILVRALGSLALDQELDERALSELLV